jgi:Phage tail protein.
LYNRRTLNLKLHNITLDRTLHINPDSPFRLLEQDKMFATDYEIMTQENAERDGVIISNTKFSARYIPLLLEFRNHRGAVEFREELIHCFSPAHECVLYVQRNNINRRINCRVSRVGGDPEYLDDPYMLNFELLCPDPHFKDTDDTTVKFLQYEPLMSFPLIFVPVAGMTTGIISASDGLKVNNIGDMNIGVIITIKAAGGIVKNPKILCNDKYIQLSTTLNTNDVAEISTMETGKYIKINGIKSRFFNRQSRFFDLKRGINYIKIEAEDNTVTNSEIAVTYTNKWFGV